MDATGYPSMGENLFFSLKRRHNDVTCTRNLPKKMRCCLLDPTMPSLIL